jgi:hypothetical protein
VAGDGGGSNSKSAGSCGGRKQDEKGSYVWPIEEKLRERRRQSGKDRRRQSDEREQNNEDAPVPLA